MGTKPRDMLWQGALHRKLLLFRVSWFIFHSSRRFNDIRFYSSFVRQTIYATTSTLERSYRLGSSRHPKFSTLHKLSEIADADLVRRERFVLQGFLNTLEKFPFKNERDINLLKEVIGRLDGLFLLVVVGEFNSGKSSLSRCVFLHRVWIITWSSSQCFTRWTFSSLWPNTDHRTSKSHQRYFECLLIIDHGS